MKKITLVSAVLIVIGLASCKKAYKCECTTSDSSGTTVTTRDISKTSEKNAEAICGNSTSVYTSSFSGGSSTTPYTQSSNTSCSLK